MSFTEKDVLVEFNRIASANPEVQTNRITYLFWLDLEHGYFFTAGSKIHLYADETRWAIVFEKNGYGNRAGRAEIELSYIGNCVKYNVEKQEGKEYVSNISTKVLIDNDEFERIENKVGSEEETFELIGKDITTVNIRGKAVRFENDHKEFERVRVKVRDFDNPNQLVAFEDLVRYLQETHPDLLAATEDDIREFIPDNLTKLMTIDEFHYTHAIPPSKQETYQLIAQILASRDTSKWKPTLKPNNHWTNWESSHL